MKRIIAFTLVLVIIALFNVLATQHSIAQEGPQITFPIHEHQFGDITEGEVVKTTFEFTNTGNAPLLISRVLTTCGCTAPEWPKSPVLPGQSGQISIQFDSSHKHGAQRKSITVVSNAPNKERLVILANVIQGK